MEALNLPNLTHILQINQQNKTIYDPCRKKHVSCTPEEWVRQNFLAFMVHFLAYPIGLVATEMTIELNRLKKRCDIVAFNNTGKPILIVECKATNIAISQKTFTQIATYNLKLKVDYLVVTNGLNHYCCKMNYEDNSYEFLQEIPHFKEY